MSYRGSESSIGKATVRRKTSLSLDPLSLDVDEGSAVTLTGKLTEASGPNIGAGVPDKTIHLYIDGNDTGVTAVTDKNGAFSINYTWSQIGEHTYQAKYHGD